MEQRLQEHNIRSIAVFCASNDGIDSKIFKEAYLVGKFLANNKIELIFGGSKLGLMGQVAKGALDNNGKVTGVIPEFLKSKEVVHTGLTSLVTTQNMHERKLKMHDLSDGFIALPGGFGTMEELFEILTWGQLGLHRKPIGILNSNHYYDDLLELLLKNASKRVAERIKYEFVVGVRQNRGSYPENARIQTSSCA